MVFEITKRRQLIHIKTGEISKSVELTTFISGQACEKQELYQSCFDKQHKGTDQDHYNLRQYEREHEYQSWKKVKLSSGLPNYIPVANISGASGIGNIVNQELTRLHKK